MKTVVLVEGIIDYKIINEENFQNSTVISFDYYSHKSLNDKKIEHNFIEDYFSEVDKKQIDDLALKLGTNWYNEKIIKKHLDYEDLNLGYLLELEMPSYFFKHLKRIIGIKKIINKETPTKIISYSLNNYIENICKNKTIETISLKNNTTSNLFFDEIEIPIKIGFIKKKIKLSRKNYFKLKKNVDEFSNKIWNVKPNMKSIKNKESILLIDFHTIDYKDLINIFPSNSKNIVILNQRKPAIWNLESLNIIKKSNCQILSLKDFETKEIKKKINLKQKELRKNMEILWKNDNVFNELFSLDNESFWEIIKKEFSEIVQKRLTESIERLVLLKELFEQMPIAAVLDWAHVAMEEKELSHIINKKNIPIFCLQHGIMTLNSNLEKYLPLMPVLPSNNSKMLVWGKIMESYILKQNIPSNEIQVVGSPRHDRFFQRRNYVTNNQTVVIASNNLFHVNFNGNDTQAYQNMEDYIKIILEFIKSNTNKKPIIKLHSSEYFNIAPIIKKIDQNIPIYQHEDLLSILENCDSLISLNYSTILIDALILNKPTMVILPEKQNFENEEIIIKEAVVSISDKTKLKLELKKFLQDKKFRNELISNGNKFIDEYFSFQGNSSNILSKLLLNLKNEKN